MSLLVCRSPNLCIIRSAVGYWEMDATTGNETDATGLGHTLVDNGTVTSGAGVVGSARVFNGTNQFFSIASGSATDFDPTLGSFTVRARVNAVTLGAASHAIFSKSDTAGNQREWLLTYLSTNIWQFSASSGGTALVNATSTVTPATATWFDLFGGYDAATNRIWISVDGEPPVYTNLNGGIFVGTAALIVGATAAGASNRWTGSIDTVGYWSRTLRFHEIRKLHEARTYASLG